MTLAGPILRFLVDSVVAFTGGDMRPRSMMWFLPDVASRAGPARQARLCVPGRARGARAYLAVAGGIDVPIVLGSRSTFVRSRFGGFEGRRCKPAIAWPRPRIARRSMGRRMAARDVPIYASRQTLRVVPGPQDEAFAPERCAGSSHPPIRSAAQSDRMGYRLDGPRIEHQAGADIVSDGTPPGAVQVTGDGLPIVLLADRGTAGGYTKIATVIGVDLARLGQMRPGDRCASTR